MNRRPRPRRRGQLTSRAWRRLRDQVVREEPFCTLRLPGCTRFTTTADHIRPVKYRPDLKLVRANLRGSCRSCNARRGTGSPRRMAQLRREQQQQRPAPALAFFD